MMGGRKERSESLVKNFENLPTLNFHPTQSVLPVRGRVFSFECEVQGFTVSEFALQHRISEPSFNDQVRDAGLRKPSNRNSQTLHFKS